jgi:Fusaric acid resistance protein family
MNNRISPALGVVSSATATSGANRWWHGFMSSTRPFDARTPGRALIFGLRLWAAVCLALYVAFSLELDKAYWAGSSAAIVCQPSLGASLRPSLGASLRKGWFLMVGTAVGAVAIVALTACFPQQRNWFSPRPGTLGRRVQPCSRATAQLCGLLGSTGRLHRGDHRERRTWRDGGRQRGGFHACHQPRQRDLHRHHLRGRRTRRDRFWRCATPAGRPARCDFG